MSDGHYFASDPATASRRQRIPLHLVDLSIELESDRGVFSAQQIDAGTRLLMLEGVHPGEAERTVLDLGCGYGPIACVAASRSPHAQVWAIDVNERAVALCAENATRLGLTNVHAGLPTDVDDALRFDLLLSNPPIRIGKAKLHNLLTTWLDRLAPTGRGELVVQKHLGSDSLLRWLNEQGYPAERRLSRASYRIIDVAPRPAGAPTPPDVSS